MFLLVLAYPGSPGQKAVKRLCVLISVFYYSSTCVVVLVLVWFKCKKRKYEKCSDYVVIVTLVVGHLGMPSSLYDQMFFGSPHRNITVDKMVWLNKSVEEYIYI